MKQHLMNSVQMMLILLWRHFGLKEKKRILPDRFKKESQSFYFQPRSTPKMHKLYKKNFSDQNGALYSSSKLICFINYGNNGGESSRKCIHHMCAVIFWCYWRQSAKIRMICAWKSLILSVETLQNKKKGETVQVKFYGINSKQQKYMYGEHMCSFICVPFAQLHIFHLSFSLQQKNKRKERLCINWVY